MNASTVVAARFRARQDAPRHCVDCGAQVQAPRLRCARCAAHREERKAYHRAYYAAHRKERKAYHRAYRAAHRKERKAYQRAYRAAHREERKAYQRAYYAAHREERKAYQRAYYAAHRRPHPDLICACGATFAYPGRGRPSTRCPYCRRAA